MSDEFTDEDFIEMVDHMDENAKNVFLKIVVSKKDYKRLAEAIVSSGVAIEWSIQAVYTNVSPLAEDVEFKGDEYK